MIDSYRSIDMLPAKQNIDIMNDVEVYDDNFTLLSKCPAVEQFRWVRRFSRPGEFLLITSFSPEKLQLYRPPIIDRTTNRVIREGNIIYKRDNDEACLITGVNVVMLLDGDIRLIVRGWSLSRILDRRVVVLNGDFTLNNLLTTIVNDNFLSLGPRSMSPLLRLISMPNFGGDIIPVEYRRSEVLTNVIDLCQENAIGLRIRYNISNRTYDLEFYNPVESVAVFDKEWGNVLEQDYIENVENYKNTVLVGENFIFNNDITGISRREMAAPEPREGATRFSQIALDALNRSRAIRTLSSRIDVESVQFEYGKDWDLGSIVLSRNRSIGFSEKEVITEIIEFFDKEGKNVEVNTGDYIERS